MRNYCDALRRNPVIVEQVRARRLRHRNQPLRAVRRRPQQEAPKRQIELSKMLRMPLMLQVVKDTDRGARREYAD